VEATYRKSAEAWGKSYKARERSQTMGQAMRVADHIFEAVALAADPAGGLPSQRAILAGAIAEIQEQARAELRAELLKEARALVAGAVRIAHAELDRVAGAVERGEHFAPEAR
jgi:hypothetical protein